LDHLNIPPEQQRTC